MKLKEYATKIKNRLVGQRAKPQEEEKDDLSEKIAERTQELIAETDRKLSGQQSWKNPNQKKRQNSRKQKETSVQM